MTPTTQQQVLPHKVPSPATLANKGVPVSVHQVRGEQGSWARVYEDGEPVYETVYVRLTSLTLATIEDQFGSVAEWEMALGVKPNATVLSTLALCWEVERHKAGLMMIDRNGAGEYSTALGAAWVIANGGDTDAVVGVLEVGLQTSKVEAGFYTRSVQAKVQENRGVVTEVEGLLAKVDSDAAEASTPTTPTTSKQRSKKTATTASTTPGDDGSSHGSSLAEASSSSGA